MRNFNFKWLVALMFCLVTPFKASSKVITVQQATKVAEQLWNRNSTRSVHERILFSWDDSVLGITTRSDGKQEPCFFVFTGENGKGFVIVSAEDNTFPILAYSFEDDAPNPNSIPESLNWWFYKVKKEIEYIRENNIINYAAKKKWVDAKIDTVFP